MRRSGFARSVQTLRARASGSPGGESKPVTPCSRYSRNPPTSVATMAQPEEAAAEAWADKNGTGVVNVFDDLLLGWIAQIARPFGQELRPGDRPKANRLKTGK